MSVENYRQFLKELGIFTLASSMAPKLLLPGQAVDIKQNLQNQGHMVDVHFDWGKELEYYTKLGELAEGFGKMERDAALAEQGVSLIKQGRSEGLDRIVAELKDYLEGGSIADKGFRDDLDKFYDQLIFKPENAQRDKNLLAAALANLHDDLLVCLPFAPLAKEASRQATGIAKETEPMERTYFGPEMLLTRMVHGLAPQVDSLLEKYFRLPAFPVGTMPGHDLAKYDLLRSLNVFGTLCLEADVIRMAFNKLDFLRSVYYFWDREHSYRRKQFNPLYRKRVYQAFIGIKNIEEINARQRRYAKITNNMLVHDGLWWLDGKDYGPVWIVPKKLEHFRALMKDFAGQLPKHEIDVLEKKAEAYLQAARK